MTIIFQKNKWASRFLILVYLLVGSGMGNALLWCQESEAFTHLEFNLSGRCPSGCMPAEGSHEEGGEATRPLPSWTSADGCLDNPVSLSHVSSQKSKRPLDDSACSGGPALHPFPIRVHPVASLAMPALVAKPPPPQALTALRTIVLLN